LRDKTLINRTIAALLLISSSIFSDTWAAEPRAALRAHAGQNTIWSISVINPSPKDCGLLFVKDKLTSPAPDVCKEISALIRQLEPTLAPSDVITRSSDGPQYELIVGKRKAPTYPRSAPARQLKNISSSGRMLFMIVNHC